MADRVRSWRAAGIPSWNNHDSHRIYLGNDQEYQAFTILLHLIWEGLLISTRVKGGMTNYPFETLDQVEEILNPLNYAWSSWKGVPLEEIMDGIRIIRTLIMPVPDAMGWKQKRWFLNWSALVGKFNQAIRNQRSRSTMIRFWHCYTIRNWFKSVRREQRSGWADFWVVIQLTRSLVAYP